MNYENKNVEFDQNISKESHLKNFFSLLLGLTGIMVVFFFILQLFINFIITYIPQNLEYKLFSAKNKNPTQQEIVVQNLLNNIKTCANLDYNLNLYIDKKMSEVNAYAVLGGDIIISNKIFDYVKSENGLAFILAHEIGHFKNRDHLKTIGMANIFNLFFGFNDNALIDIIANFEFSSFSRKAEQNADNTALEILNCYYGHIGGANEFFKNLANDKENKFENLLGTHPLFKERIASIKNSKYSVKDIKPLDPILLQK